MISSLLFLLAGIFNAICDTVKDHFYESIFNYGWLEKYSWWTNEDYVAWYNKYVWKADILPIGLKELPPRNKIPITFTSLWHLSKSLMLICICLGTALSAELEFIDLILVYFVDYNYWIYLTIKFIWFRSLFGLGFFTFYNYILIKK